MRINPRGRITGTNRKVVTRGGAEFDGMKPLLIVHCKADKRSMRHFTFHAKKCGASLKRIPTDNRLVYEVCGTPQALEHMTGNSSVLEWHFPLDVKPCPGIFHRAAGSGAEKPVKFYPRDHADFKRDDMRK